MRKNREALGLSFAFAILNAVSEHEALLVVHVLKPTDVILARQSESEGNLLDHILFEL